MLRPWLEVEPDAVLPGRGPIADLLRRDASRRGGAAMKRTHASTLVAFVASRARRRATSVELAIVVGGRHGASCRRSRSPITLVGVGGVVVALALPIRRAVKGTATEAHRPVLRDARRHARQGVQPERRAPARRRARHHAVPPHAQRGAAGVDGRGSRSPRRSARRSCSPAGSSPSTSARCPPDDDDEEEPSDAHA